MNYERQRQCALERDGYRCQICGTTKRLTVHHIVPRSHGGGHELDNLITLCEEFGQGCHEKVQSYEWKLSFENGMLVVEGYDGRVWFNDNPSLSPKIDSAVSLHNDLLSCINELTNTFWDMGRILKDIRDNMYYETLDYESFPEYLSSPELNISYDTATKLIRVRERMDKEIQRGRITKDDVLEMKLEKADRISRYVGREDFPEWVEMAKVLTQNELKLELKEAKKGKPLSLKERFDKNTGLPDNNWQPDKKVITTVENKEPYWEPSGLAVRLEDILDMYYIKKSEKYLKRELSKLTNNFLKKEK